jgi:hypothetical protein
MRDIRNYGVHPRHLSDGDVEIYFEEDKCGLLFLEAHATSNAWPRSPPRPPGQPETRPRPTALAGPTSRLGSLAGACPLRGLQRPAWTCAFV